MRTLSKSYLVLPALCALALPAAAAIISETYTFTDGVNIPQLQDPPLVFLQAISHSGISSLTGVQVSLDLVGNPVGDGFASDMFVSLNQNLGATAILLNQVGVTASNPVGAGYDGWNVTFADNAANGDVHLANPSSGVMTGTWQPDGRTIPTSGTRPDLLSVFNGSAGDGAWRLAVGDLDLGGTMRLEGWSITLTGESAVPEPSSVGAGVGALVLALAIVRKKTSRCWAV